MLFASLPASTQATPIALRGQCRPTIRRVTLRCPLALAFSVGLKRPSSVMPRGPGFEGGQQIGAGLLGSWFPLLSLAPGRTTAFWTQAGHRILMGPSLTLMRVSVFLVKDPLSFYLATSLSSALVC